MSTTKTLNQAQVVVPATKETGWDDNVSILLLSLIDLANGLIAFIGGQSLLLLQSTSTSVVQDGTLSPTHAVHKIQGSGGPVTLGATTALGNGSRADQMLILQGDHATNTVTILNGANVQLRQAITLARYENLLLRWDLQTQDWIEVGRSTGAAGGVPAHVLATTSALGAEHTVSGLTAGQYLRATGATTAKFQTIQLSDLGTGTPDATTFLSGDGSWKVPPGGGGGGTDELVKLYLGGTQIGTVARKLNLDLNSFSASEDSGNNRFDIGIKKDLANGVAGLSAGLLVLPGVMGTGAATNAKYLRGDQVWTDFIHTLADTVGLGPGHTTSGLTTGQFLRATGATAAAFQTIQNSDLGSGTPDATTYLRGDRTWSNSFGSITIVRENSPFQSVTATTGSTAIDFALGMNIRVTLQIASTTFSFVNNRAGERSYFYLKQDAIGNRTVSWPAKVKWRGGVAPTLSTAGNSRDVVCVMYDSGDDIYLAEYATAFA